MIACPRCGGELFALGCLLVCVECDAAYGPDPEPER